MPTTLLPVPTSLGKAEQRASRLAFFVIGLSGAAWAPLTPFAKSRNPLNAGPLALLLLCLGIGAILAMPVGRAWRRVMGVSEPFRAPWDSLTWLRLRLAAGLPKRPWA
jgi:hypothetical protein